MRRWCMIRALDNADKNADFLQQWIAEADFDGSEYGTDYLQIYVGDVLEQWQIMPDGWAFGRIRLRSPSARGSSESRRGAAVGLFPARASLKM